MAAAFIHLDRWDKRTKRKDPLYEFYEKIAEEERAARKLRAEKMKAEKDIEMVKK